jgi:tRNA pseudouridine(38-40) synthase
LPKYVRYYLIYRYIYLLFNVMSRGNLDLDRIRAAARYLIGTHDFRNFCKLDINNTEPTFIRRIDRIEIELFERDRTVQHINPG